MTSNSTKQKIQYMYEYTVLLTNPQDPKRVVICHSPLATEDLQKMSRATNAIKKCYEEYTLNYKTRICTFKEVWREDSKKWKVVFLNDESIELTNMQQFPQTESELIAFLRRIRVIHPQHYTQGHDHSVNNFTFECTRSPECIWVWTQTRSCACFAESKHNDEVTTAAASSSTTTKTKNEKDSTPVYDNVHKRRRKTALERVQGNLAIAMKRPFLEGSSFQSKRVSNNKYRFGPY